MSTDRDAPLAWAIEGMAPPGVLAGMRSIGERDEFALLPAEVATMATRRPERRRASGAARLVARDLLARLGHPATAIVKAASGAPVWPADILGSLAHDETIAVAAVARRLEAGALGIDVEPAEPLGDDVQALVVTALDWGGPVGDPLYGRLVFAAKEAVYKAVFQRDGARLEYEDIRIGVGGHVAITRDGLVLQLRHCVRGHIVVLAFLAAAA